jgi:hypothetical protein
MPRAQLLGAPGPSWKYGMFCVLSKEFEYMQYVASTLEIDASERLLEQLRFFVASSSSLRPLACHLQFRTFQHTGIAFQQSLGTSVQACCCMRLQVAAVNNTAKSRTPLTCTERTRGSNCSEPYLLKVSLEGIDGMIKGRARNTDNLR